MADRIIREKGEKDMYTCASGITPSGTVHIGNFREIITVELVVRALRERGKNVRFIYSWDDYDVFRKVPKNMPEPELLETYLRKPITLVPDTTGRAENYARGNEVAVEKVLPTVGVSLSISIRHHATEAISMLRRSGRHFLSGMRSGQYSTSIVRSLYRRIGGLFLYSHHSLTVTIQRSSAGMESMVLHISMRSSARRRLSISARRRIRSSHGVWTGR